MGDLAVSKKKNKQQQQQFYLDTNVFISRFKADDPYWAEARAIISGLGDGDILAETSVLTLLEVASVSGRLYEARKGNNEEEEEEENGKRKKNMIFVIRMLRRLAELKPKFINISGETPISVSGIQASLPSVFN